MGPPFFVPVIQMHAQKCLRHFVFKGFADIFPCPHQAYKIADVCIEMVESFSDQMKQFEQKRRLWIKQSSILTVAVFVGAH